MDSMICVMSEWISSIRRTSLSVLTVVVYECSNASFDYKLNFSHGLSLEQNQQRLVQISQN